MLLIFLDENYANFQSEIKKIKHDLDSLCMKLGIDAHLSNVEIHHVIPLILKKFNKIINGDVNEFHINCNNITEHQEQFMDVEIIKKKEHTRK